MAGLTMVIVVLAALVTEEVASLSRTAITRFLALQDHLSSLYSLSRKAVLSHGREDSTTDPVPSCGIEPPSTRLQRVAFTRYASRAKRRRMVPPAGIGCYEIVRDTISFRVTDSNGDRRLQRPPS